MAHIQLVGVSEPKSPDNKIWKFPYALPIIISGLRQSKHTFEVIDSHLQKLEYQELTEYLLNKKSKIFVISAWSHNYKYVKELTKTLKENLSNPLIIIGGIISVHYKTLMEKTMVDIVITGAEGEKILPKLLDEIDKGKLKNLEQINGIVFRKGNSFFKTPPHKVMTNEEFNKEPLPAYDYFDKELKELAKNINSLTNQPVKGFPLLTARGCPFSCTFCGHLYGRKMLRKTWKNFFDEVEYLINNYGVKGFYSFDTNTFLNEKDVEDFCAEYQKRKLSFLGCYEMRLSFGSVEMFKKLYECGGRVLLFGFESGSPKMLKNMKKGVTLEQMKRTVKNAIEAGMIVYGNFIYGTIGENRKTVQETKNFLLFLEKLYHNQKKEFKKQNKISTSSYARSFLIPLPPSELFQICEEQGLIKNEDAYLEYLSDDSLKERVKGRAFRIKLNEMGGNINMSEFSSMKALKYYVDYTWSNVKLNTLFFEPKKILQNSEQILKTFLIMVKFYLLYLVQLIKDKIKGKKGFFKKDE